MDIIITPRKLKGSLSVIPSKSQAHRLLICAAFADRETTLICPETNRDMETTAQCLNALGASIQRTESGFHIKPVQNTPEEAVLICHDSGSTLRFMLPIVGALGVTATFFLEGRLAQRPLSPLWEEMERMGCLLSRPQHSSILCKGRLKAGEYRIDGGISSQFITGLLLALPLLKQHYKITVTGTLESKPYVDMTQHAMSLFGVSSDNYELSGTDTFRSPGTVNVEGDWSNGAFFLAAQALGNPVSVMNLSEDSTQGDRQAVQLIPALENPVTISAAHIPDLVPILSLVAASRKGARFTDIRRLRLKESDRVSSVVNMITALGGSAEAAENTLTIHGTGLHGGIVDAVNDHRIAMTAAIASTICNNPVIILGAECVEKSYPQFWKEFCRLGGHYEQYIR